MSSVCLSTRYRSAVGGVASGDWGGPWAGVVLYFRGVLWCCLTQPKRIYVRSHVVLLGCGDDIGVCM